MSKNILFWLNVESVYPLIQGNHERYKIVLQVHARIVNCCVSLLNKQLPFEER